ncbi:MAG: HlyC/CorC family transporter [Gammaproteobacteria bacterium]|nr:HlyC/CorC family transporter [Gammaproteobacteria bacterium]
MGELTILLVLLVLSGVFSGSETALIGLSKGRVEALVNEGRLGSGALYQLKKDPSQMLTTILIGNNLVNIAASAMATVIATREFGSMGPGLAVGVLTLFILIFGEITPKSLATRYPERISLIIAIPLLAFMRLIYPLVWLFSKFTSWLYQLTGAKGEPTVTESELINMLGHGVREGEIEHDEKEIIERVFAFNDLTVRDVMAPIKDVFSLDGKLTVADAVHLVISKPFSRIPLRNRQTGHFDKLLHLRDLLEASASGQHDVIIENIAHEPLYAPQYLAIDILFARFRRQNRIFAIVVDEFGGERGIVTLEDLMEELVGEIYDESDVTPSSAEKISDDEIMIKGEAELRILESFFDRDLPGKPTDTVGLWILNHTETIPKTGDVFTINNLSVTIVQATSRNIEQVSVCRSRPQVADPKIIAQ